MAGWFDLASTVRDLSRRADVRVVVLRAEGKGFNAGVDIKEMQATEGFEALIGANRGCYEAFAAVYECAVPVIAAVNGFCVGGGIGLVGNADVIVAADDATFGLPEVDRGALGAATHLSRLVPQHKARAMVYTSATATAHELHAFGSVLEVVPLGDLRDAAYPGPGGGALPRDPSGGLQPRGVRLRDARPPHEAALAPPGCHRGRRRGRHRLRAGGPRRRGEQPPAHPRRVPVVGRGHRPDGTRFREVADPS